MRTIYSTGLIRLPVVVLLVVFGTVCTAQASEPPESIIGTWQVDLVRTMTEHLERMAASGRASVDPAHIASMQATFSRQAVQQQIRSAAITITEDAIISSDPNSGTTRIRYKVIGGNARLVVVESLDDGFESVVNIRLVDTGIAIETTDCRTYPEECVRQQRRAIATVKKRTDQPSMLAASPDGLVVASACSEGECAGEPVQHQQPTDQPRWVYFTRIGNAVQR